jgi:hypothetical protein
MIDSLSLLRQFHSYHFLLFPIRFRFYFLKQQQQQITRTRSFLLILQTFHVLRGGHATTIDLFQFSITFLAESIRRTE